MRGWKKLVIRVETRAMWKIVVLFAVNLSDYLCTYTKKIFSHLLLDAKDDELLFQLLFTIYSKLTLRDWHLTMFVI